VTTKSIGWIFLTLGIFFIGLAILIYVLKEPASSPKKEANFVVEDVDSLYGDVKKALEDPRTKKAMQECIDKAFLEAKLTEVKSETNRW